MTKWPISYLYYNLMDSKLDVNIVNSMNIVIIGHTLTTLFTFGLWMPLTWKNKKLSYYFENNSVQKEMSYAITKSKWQSDQIHTFITIQWIPNILWICWWVHPWIANLQASWRKWVNMMTCSFSIQLLLGIRSSYIPSNRYILPLLYSK